MINLVFSAARRPTYRGKHLLFVVFWGFSSRLVLNLFFLAILYPFSLQFYHSSLFCYLRCFCVCFSFNFPPLFYSFILLLFDFSEIILCLTKKTDHITESPNCLLDFVFAVLFLSVHFNVDSTKQFGFIKLKSRKEKREWQKIKQGKKGKSCATLWLTSSGRGLPCDHFSYFTSLFMIDLPVFCCCVLLSVLLLFSFSF